MMGVPDDRDDEYMRILAECARGIQEYDGDADAVTHLDLGLAYLEMGLLDDAEAEFTVVLDANPNDGPARAGLKLVRYRRQDGSCAIGRA